MPAERTPTKSSELRRSTKPIMEKRRRARINSSLAELKNLILDALKKDNARHSKLEKADILEMTVKHLQNLQRQQMTVGVTPDTAAMVAKFRAGFNECANEVSRFLCRIDGVDSAVRQRLLSHLGSCLSSLNAPAMQPVHIQVPKSPVGGSLQLVPTRLPSGEIAFLLPCSPAPEQTAESGLLMTAGGIPSSSPSPVNILGSSGILSPAASDCSVSCPSPTSPYQPVSVPISPVLSRACLSKDEGERVWRPW